MKTIEEKAKAYDEALKWMRELYPGLHGAIKEDAEHHFPELRESEDERIRKKLIGIFTNQSLCDVYNLKSEDVLAYLEKQKEQKIAEKQDYSGLNDFERAIHRGFLCAGVENVPVTIIKETAKDCLAQIKFRSVEEARKACEPDYVILKKEDYERLQKPTEWSEEDEYITNNIFGFIKENTSNPHRRLCAEECLSWLKNRLKSLRPQPKQELQIKEGDKVSIHCRKDRKEDIITIYDGKVGEVIHVWDAKRNPWGHIVVRLDNGCNNGFYEDELEILNEPKWKPSEEQMRGLKYFLDYHRPQRNAGTTAWKEFDSVDSLYNDLLKLKSL